MRTKSSNLKLVFTDLKVAIKKRLILENVSGEAISGDLLAIMGCTGSGKTTLLNVLAGRISVTEGRISLNGSPVDKQQRRRFGYVIQEDIFLSNLTLWETLYFTAMIRISEEVPKKQKIERINAIVECLGLQKCIHTVVGDIFKPGLSGGEKKRASIACELLADPDILLIDEPTSGLDSNTAKTLMKELKNYAREYNKIILAAIHQPSTEIFGIFSTLLLLGYGQTAYFGKSDLAIDSVTGLGMLYTPNINPADFLCCGNNKICLFFPNYRYIGHVDLGGNAMKMIEKNRKTCESLWINSNHLINQNCLENDRVQRGNQRNQQLHFKTDKQKSSDSIKLHIFKKNDSELSLCSKATEDNSEVETVISIWPTSLWTQLRMLIWRSFKQSKGRILHKFDLIQAFIIAAIAGILYFQIKQSSNTKRDRMGLVIFAFVYFGFELMVMTIAGCYSDRGVYLKDRAAGAYRLSAFYLAKIISDMPLILIVPSLFHTAVYWMAGLGNVDGYMIFLGISMLYCLLVQGLADVIGFLDPDSRFCLAISNVLNVGSLLLGGFYNIHPPEWLSWAKYMSHIHYPYAAIMTYLLERMDPIRCNQTNIDDFLQCLGNSTEILSPRDILVGIGIELPIYCYIMTMMLLLCVIRIIGYFILKFRRT